MLKINGGKPLNGTVKISGSKNAAVAIMVASLLTKNPVILDNVPLIEDVFDLRNILNDLGADISLDINGRMIIETDRLSGYAVTEPSALKIRASAYLMGALLGRFGRAVVPLPGGCKIGARPLDFHINAFKKMGADVQTTEEKIYLTAKNLHGASITLPFPSVGASINIMLAAVLAEGETIIKNAAREPHVVDTARFLIGCGAKITGMGTDTIKIIGVKKLNLREPHKIINDQIEAGTFMLLAAAVRGSLKLLDCPVEDLTSVIKPLKNMGAKIHIEKDGLNISAEGRLEAIDIVTAPHPGFPTDLQQSMMTLMCTCHGTSTLTETIFEGRFKNADELIKMGAKIHIDKSTAIIEGVEKLLPSSLSASDLRSSAALIGAGLAADGTTIIINEEYLYRGYENILLKLNAVNAEVLSV